MKIREKIKVAIVKQDYEQLRLIYVHVHCHLLILRTPFTHQFPWGRYSRSLLSFLHNKFLKTVQFIV